MGSARPGPWRAVASGLGQTKGGEGARRNAPAWRGHARPEGAVRKGAASHPPIRRLEEVFSSSGRGGGKPARGAPAPTAACAGAGTTATATAVRRPGVPRKGLPPPARRRRVRARAAPNRSATGATAPRKRFPSSPPGRRPVAESGTRIGGGQNRTRIEMRCVTDGHVPKGG
mmetsp:Transcript_25733/g.51206  ORF Transcript_25733/g.51206 Transcript_25733/m.51206 type:complete len:172 (+) Transcript_25733:513-1028(+)